MLPRLLSLHLCKWSVSMELDLDNPLASFVDDAEEHQRIEALFSAEPDHVIAADGAIDLALRKDAVSVILHVIESNRFQRQAQFIFDDRVDPFVAYLAVNYVDRFLSKRQIPREKPWIVRLLSIACVSLASKMTASSFSVACLQGDRKGLRFDARAIARMEMLILRELEWRMRSITPFSFFPFFASFFSPVHSLLLRTRAAIAVLRAQEDIRTMGFKPSVVAAAALLSAADVLLPTEFNATGRSDIFSCEFMNNDELSECLDLMRETSAISDVRGAGDGYLRRRRRQLKPRECVRRRMLVGRPASQEEVDACPPPVLQI